MPQTVGGGAAFVAVLALSQALQGFVLRVSCTTPLGLPTALGENVRLRCDRLLPRACTEMHFFGCRCGCTNTAVAVGFAQSMELKK